MRPIACFALLSLCAEILAQDPATPAMPAVGASRADVLQALGPPSYSTVSKEGTEILYYEYYESAAPDPSDPTLSSAAYSAFGGLRIDSKKISLLEGKVTETKESKSLIPVKTKLEPSLKGQVVRVVGIRAEGPAVQATAVQARTLVDVMTETQYNLRIRWQTPSGAVEGWVPWSGINYPLSDWMLGYDKGLPMKEPPKTSVAAQGQLKPHGGENSNPNQRFKQLKIEQSASNVTEFDPKRRITLQVVETATLTRAAGSEDRVADVSAGQKVEIEAMTKTQFRVSFDAPSGKVVGWVHRTKIQPIPPDAVPKLFQEIASDEQVREAIRNKQPITGMKRADLIKALGKPKSTVVDKEADTETSTFEVIKTVKKTETRRQWQNGRLETYTSQYTQEQTVAAWRVTLRNGIVVKQEPMNVENEIRTTGTSVGH